jgi:hypothetical protein
LVLARVGDIGLPVSEKDMRHEDGVKRHETISYGAGGGTRLLDRRIGPE